MCVDGVDAGHLPGYQSERTTHKRGRFNTIHSLIHLNTDWDNIDGIWLHDVNTW